MTSNAIRGAMFAVPVSLLLWALIVLIWWLVTT